MSRRRKPTAHLLMKVGCTNRGNHRRIIFDTIELSPATDVDGNPYVRVKHNAERRPDDHNETNTQTGFGPWYANQRYVCPLCSHDFPLKFERESDFFGRVFAAGVSFVDISVV